ncbi:MAG: hypothetical protein FWG15_02725 [Propionibacteriaceae bacterium]|nr:hypothetical protein [Propionibacteriaceae bacterium]
MEYLFIAIDGDFDKFSRDSWSDDHRVPVHGEYEYCVVDSGEDVLIWDVVFPSAVNYIRVSSIPDI